jgi:hypothetical protein
MGFCYTQLTDVEQEQNGLYTYRREPKFPPEVIAPPSTGAKPPWRNKRAEDAVARASRRRIIRTEKNRIIRLREARPLVQTAPNTAMPDFGGKAFAAAPEVRTQAAPGNGPAPDEYYATSIFPNTSSWPDNGG